MGSRRPSATRKALLGIGAACGMAAALGIVVLALIGYQKVMAEPPPPPEASDSSPRQKAASVPPAQSLRAQVQRVERATDSGRRVPISLDMCPEEVCELVRDDFRAWGVDELEMQFCEGTIVARTRGNVTWQTPSGRTVRIGRRHVRTTIRISPQTENGRLRLHIQDAQVGTMPIPTPIRERLERDINDSLPTWVETAQVTPDRMVLSGHTDAR